MKYEVSIINLETILTSSQIRCFNFALMVPFNREQKNLFKPDFTV
ncbi:unnamed protein product [Tenebrio molitor]|nr:unnamed protein product [Tenebrio molitor]